MNKSDFNSEKKTGLSRRQFLTKGALASAFATMFASPGLVNAEQSAAAKLVDYNPPVLSDPEASTICLIPDVQTYVKTARNQGILELMTAWIRENCKKLNMITALQLGDLVERNGITDLSEEKSKAIDQVSAQQWNATSLAFSRLDGVLPYVVCTGNHDYGITAAENRFTQFPTYFPLNRNTAWKGVFVEACKNRNGVRTLENAAFEFSTKQGKKIMVISLEFAPSDPVIEWAKEFAARDAYKDHFIILITHSYMLGAFHNCKLFDKEGYLVTDVNYGQAIWDKLIYPSSNIRMVCCGHVAGLKDPRENVGFRQDKNHAGKVVSQMLFDMQTIGGGWHGNGGDGWLRLLEFSPDFKKVSAKTFSPLFAISPSTQQLAWDHADYNEFTFDLD